MTLHFGHVWMTSLKSSTRHGIHTHGQNLKNIYSTLYFNIFILRSYWANAMKLLSVKSALHNAAYANCKPSQSPRLFCGSRSYLILAFGTVHANRFRAENRIYYHLLQYYWLDSSYSMMGWCWIVCGRCKSSLSFVLKFIKNVIFCICKLNKLFCSILSLHFYYYINKIEPAELDAYSIDSYEGGAWGKDVGFSVLPSLSYVSIFLSRTSINTSLLRVLYFKHINLIILSHISHEFVNARRLHKETIPS